MMGSSPSAGNSFSSWCVSNRMCESGSRKEPSFCQPRRFAPLLRGILCWLVSSNAVSHRMTSAALTEVTGAPKLIKLTSLRLSNSTARSTVW